MIDDEGAFSPEINAITLVTTDMARSLAFYRQLGVEVAYGGPEASFTSLRIGRNFINLSAEDGDTQARWGRVIFHVDSPDRVWQRLIDGGIEPSFAPRDAPWGERYFHVLDPDGHELSFARPIAGHPRAPDGSGGSET